MPQARRSRSKEGGDVALVLGGGSGLGRAVALRLAANETPVVVQGPDERAVARVVGEITCGGGAARHVTGELVQLRHVEAAIERAVEAFGALRYVVLTTFDADLARRVTEALRGPLEKGGAGGRLVLALDFGPPETRASVTELVSELAARLEPLGATANAVLWRDRGEDDPERAADVLLFLCSEAADGVSGEVIAVRGQAHP